MKQGFVQVLLRLMRSWIFFPTVTRQTENKDNSKNGDSHICAQKVSAWKITQNWGG